MCAAHVGAGPHKILWAYSRQVVRAQGGRPSPLQGGPVQDALVSATWSVVTSLVTSWHHRACDVVICYIGAHSAVCQPRSLRRMSTPTPSDATIAPVREAVE